MVKHLPVIQETWLQSLGQEDPLERGMATHSSILAGEFHGQRSLEEPKLLHLVKELHFAKVPGKQT